MRCDAMRCDAMRCDAHSVTGSVFLSSVFKINFMPPVFLYDFLAKERKSAGDITRTAESL